MRSIGNSRGQSRRRRHPPCGHPSSRTVRLEDSAHLRHRHEIAWLHRPACLSSPAAPATASDDTQHITALAFRQRSLHGLKNHPRPRATDRPASLRALSLSPSPGPRRVTAVVTVMPANSTPSLGHLSPAHNCRAWLVVAENIRQEVQHRLE